MSFIFFILPLFRDIILEKDLLILNSFSRCSFNQSCFLNYSRLPDTKANLPYCWSVVIETLRLIPQTGFGTPHHSDKTICVDGFKIPVGMDVYPDLMGILRYIKDKFTLSLLPISIDL